MSEAKIPINKAKWNVNGLPAGISFNSGILSGTPTTVGEYEASVSVETNWGAGTGSLSICVLSSLWTYEIRQFNRKIEEVTIPQLIASIQDGTAQEKYNTTNTQLILPVKDPTSPWYFDEEEGYEYPMNFCSFREVILADGSRKPGLVLMGGKGLCQVRFDEKETSNPDEDRAAHGNNRWLHSNIRQWMNGRGTDWYTAAHEYDEPLPQLTMTSATTGFETRSPMQGLLDCFPDDFSRLISAVRVQTQAPIADGGGIDVTYDKFFLPSLEESYAAVTSDPDTAAAPGVEGAAWEYWISKSEGAPQGENYDYVWTEARPMTSRTWYEKCAIWTRSADLKTTSDLWYFGKYGSLYTQEADNKNCEFAPACVLC